MTISPDNFDKMQQALEKSLRIAEALDYQTFALSPLTSNFCATAASINSSAITNATRALSSPGLSSALEAVTHPGVITAAEAIANSGVVRAAKSLSCSTFLSAAVKASISIPQETLDSMALAQKLVNRLNLPPVYSISSAAAEIASKITDSISGDFTSEFFNLAIEIREMPIASFEYSFDDSGNINLSDPLEDKLSDIIDVKSSQSNSHRKVISKNSFIMLWCLSSLLSCSWGITFIPMLN